LSIVQTKSIFLCLLGCFLTAFMSACGRTQPAEIPVEPKTSPKADDWWTPEPGQQLQVQYEGEIDLDVKTDVIALDLFEATPQEISHFHNHGIKVICYLNAGAWEEWRPDRDDFPEEIIGAKYDGWPGERWLDIRQLQVLQPILEARLDLCVNKGFDGVAPDNLDGYDNPTGFAITAEDQIIFNRWLAQAAHQRGLSIGLKNNPGQAHILVDEFDWITTENCFKQNWCRQVSVFVEAGKPVFAIEYREEGMRLDDFCKEAAMLGIDAVLKNKRLDAWLAVCPEVTFDPD